MSKQVHYFPLLTDGDQRRLATIRQHLEDAAASEKRVGQMLNLLDAQEKLTQLLKDFVSRDFY